MPKISLVFSNQKECSKGRERLASNGKPIIELAQRIKLVNVLDYHQALNESERAVAIAVDVMMRGKLGPPKDEFFNAVLSQVAEKTRRGDFEGGISTIAKAVSELGAADRVSRLALL